jgi:hypothetical protein
MPLLTLLISLFLSVSGVVDGSNAKSPNQENTNPPREQPASNPDQPDFIIIDVEAP